MFPALLLATASTVNAHGFMIQPVGLNLQVANKVNVQGSPCGIHAVLPVKPEVLSAGKTILKPGDEVTMTYVIQNGDGSGPINVQFDPTGTGKFGGAGSTGNATVTKQVPGKLGLQDKKGGQPKPERTPAAFSFIVPTDLNCPNGCLLRMSQADRQFGACVVIQTGNKTVIPDPVPVKSGRDAGLELLDRQKREGKTPGEIAEEEKKKAEKAKKAAEKAAAEKAAADKAAPNTAAGGAGGANPSCTKKVY